MEDRRGHAISIRRETLLLLLLFGLLSLSHVPRQSKTSEGSTANEKAQSASARSPKTPRHTRALHDNGRNADRQSTNVPQGEGLASVLS